MDKPFLTISSIMQMVLVTFRNYVYALIVDLSCHAFKLKSFETFPSSR